MFLETFFHCQHAQRDSDKLDNDSRNLAILRTEGIENSGSEEPLPLRCFLSRAQINFMSMTNHAVGIGTYTHSGMKIPSCLDSEMHLHKIH